MVDRKHDPDVARVAVLKDLQIETEKYVRNSERWMVVLSVVMFIQVIFFTAMVLRIFWLGDAVFTYWVILMGCSLTGGGFVWGHCRAMRDFVVLSSLREINMAERMHQHNEEFHELDGNKL